MSIVLCGQMMTTCQTSGNPVPRLNRASGTVLYVCPWSFTAGEGEWIRVIRAKSSQPDISLSLIRWGTIVFKTEIRTRIEPIFSMPVIFVIRRSTWRSGNLTRKKKRIRSSLSCQLEVKHCKYLAHLDLLPVAEVQWKVLSVKAREEFFWTHCVPYCWNLEPWHGTI